ncbi:hypothetical protein ACFP9V_22905 [Deinococcus radiopugnans]|uniref:DUF2680 domain-containing protein n=1 Tax=Deinococcus radiopugnans ATCC 19172 TaxID=585398 RepID=A0A5C4Y4D6_9DEIO|nr:hypothetical protein [Deinococcus radiopugnans]MBB6017105.1 hypothetical protein [Deinococcus radiopugnans ATCC 19172]TNM70665.1 hypothetical protein FHR04_12240 [Deinococcus radiopugnans ATCC 19172]
MSRFKTIFRKTPLIALAALPLTVGAVLAQQAGTATASATAQAQTQRVQPTQPGQRNQTPGGTSTQTVPTTQSGTNYADVYLQKLAAGLGISLDKLKAAALAAGTATIDQGVKAGDIASNRATEMKTRLATNPFGMLGRGMGGHGGGRGMHGFGGHHGSLNDNDADDAAGQADSGTVDPNAVNSGS